MSWRTFVLFLAVAFAGEIAQAADPRLTVTVDPKLLPPGHQTESGLYLTAREAHRVATTLPRIVVIDVRTHGETLFNGVASPMHRHIPYVMFDVDQSYDTKNERYRLEPNPDFVKAVEMLLTEIKLDRTATLVVYCSVGERSARATNLLSRSGFTSVYSVADGFEGEASSKVGPGWKASGLPWSQQLKPQQAYKSPSM